MLSGTSRFLSAKIHIDRKKKTKIRRQGVEVTCRSCTGRVRVAACNRSVESKLRRVTIGIKPGDTMSVSTHDLRSTKIYGRVSMSDWNGERSGLCFCPTLRSVKSTEGFRDRCSRAILSLAVSAVEPVKKMVESKWLKQNILRDRVDVTYARRLTRENLQRGILYTGHTYERHRRCLGVALIVKKPQHLPCEGTSQAYLHRCNTLPGQEKTVPMGMLCMEANRRS